MDWREKRFSHGSSLSKGATCGGSGRRPKKPARTINGCKVLALRCRVNAEPWKSVLQGNHMLYSHFKRDWERRSSQDALATLWGGGWLGGSGSGDGVKRTNEKCHRRSLVWPGSHEGGTRVETRAHFPLGQPGRWWCHSGAERPRKNSGGVGVEERWVWFPLGPPFRGAAWGTSE